MWTVWQHGLRPIPSFNVKIDGDSPTAIFRQSAPYSTNERTDGEGDPRITAECPTATARTAPLVSMEIFHQHDLVNFGLIAAEEQRLSIRY